jgi:peptidoglycan/xylan/chitin deacetylase (PgdA/CDA1 family)
MLSSGLISFASHTLTHPWLPELTSELQLKKEIFGSKKILEDKLGTKINIFCYPGGRFNAKIRQMVIDAGYKVAIATKMGSASGNRDLFALRRIRISEGDGNIFIFWFKVSGYYNAFRSKKNGY